MSPQTTPRRQARPGGEEEHPSVRRHRRLRLAALATVVPAALALAACSPGRAPGSSASSGPSVAASPTTAATADLTLITGVLGTNGSDGPADGELTLTVRNNGPDRVGTLDLTFTLSSKVQPNGSDWTGCTRDGAGDKQVCNRPAPAVGESTRYRFTFHVDLTDRYANPLVMVQPRGATDPNQADNEAESRICTNGCVDTTSDLGVSAGKLITDGSVGKVTGTVKITVRNQGPDASDVIDLSFKVGEGIQPLPPAQQPQEMYCAAADGNGRAHCYGPAVKAGGSVTFSVKFSVDLKYRPTLVVSVQPDGTDLKPADNTVSIETCTNGC